MSYWFVGTGEFAAMTLPLLAKNFTFSHVITKNPTRGNRMKEEISPVEREALLLGLPLFRTARLSDDAALKDVLIKNPPKAIFVIDFGEIIREPFLSSPKLGCINIHPSLLPKYRGAAPIQRALENGEEEIGVTLFRLASEIDSGEIIYRTSGKFPLSANSLDVMKRTAVLGCELAARMNAAGENHELQPQNNSEATFAPKISKDECHQSFDIDAIELHNRVRAFYPSPCVWVEWGGKRLKLIETLPTEDKGVIGEIIELNDGYPIVGCRKGALCLKQVQPEGKRIMQGSEWARGAIKR